MSCEVCQYWSEPGVSIKCLPCIQGGLEGFVPIGCLGVSDELEFNVIVEYFTYTCHICQHIHIARKNSLNCANYETQSLNDFCECGETIGAVPVPQNILVVWNEVSL